MNVESKSRVCSGVLPVRFRPNIFADAVIILDDSGKHTAEFLCYAKSTDFHLLFCKCCGSGAPEISEIKGPEETEYRIDVQPRQLVLCPFLPLFASLIVRSYASEVAVWNTVPGYYHLAAKLDEGPNHGMHYNIPGIRHAKSISWLDMDGQANTDAADVATLLVLLSDAVVFAAVQRRKEEPSWQVKELFRVDVSGNSICCALSKNGNRLLVGGHGQMTCIAWDRAPSHNGEYEVRHFVCAGDCTKICAVYESAFVCRVEQTHESSFASSESSLEIRRRGQQPSGDLTPLIQEVESIPQDGPSAAQVQSSISNQSPRRSLLVPFSCRWHARCGKPLEISGELLAVGLHQQTEHIATALFDGPARVSFWRLAPSDQWNSSSDIWQQATDADLTSEGNGMQISGLAVWPNGSDAFCHVMLAESSGDRSIIAKRQTIRCLPMPSLSANCNTAIASVAAAENGQSRAPQASQGKEDLSDIAAVRSELKELRADFNKLFTMVQSLATSMQKDGQASSSLVQATGTETSSAAPPVTTHEQKTGSDWWPSFPSMTPSRALEQKTSPVVSPETKQERATSRGAPPATPPDHEKSKTDSDRLHHHHHHHQADTSNGAPPVSQERRRSPSKSNKDANDSSGAVSQEKGHHHQSTSKSNKDANDSSGAQKSDYGVDMKVAIEEHNRLRKMHGAPPLEWDDECAKHAQAQAQACADKDQLFHGNSHEFKEGQNIFMSNKGGQPNNDGAKEATNSWYGEVKDYDFSKPGFAADTGHFTQVVWVGTQKVGMAKVSKSSTCYIAANYSPAGNMQGDFPKNVLKASK